MTNKNKLTQSCDIEIIMEGEKEKGGYGGETGKEDNIGNVNK